MNYRLRMGFFYFKDIVKNNRAKSQILVKEQVGGDKVKIGIFFQKINCFKKGGGEQRDKI